MLLTRHHLLRSLASCRSGRRSRQSGRRGASGVGDAFALGVGGAETPVATCIQPLVGLLTPSGIVSAKTATRFFKARQPTLRLRPRLPPAG